MYNTGSDVLSVLIARASGQSLENFLQERIFEPLGMKDTGFSVPAASLDRLATSYWTNPGNGELVVYDKAEGGQWSQPPAFDPARLDVSQSTERLPRFLDHGLPGDRRLRCLISVALYCAAVPASQYKATVRSESSSSSQK